MDIRLREIVGKSAGTYFIVTDNSTITDIEETSNLRLVFISSPKGAVNTIFIFQKGDVAGFNTIFGKSSRKQEKRGNYSLKTAEQMLQGGPVAVMNLRAFEDIDKVGVVGINPNTTVVEAKELPYTQCFNTNNLWTIKPKQIIKGLTTGHLLNFANVGDSDSAIFCVKSKSTYSKQTSEGNLTLAGCSLEIDEYPGLNFETMLKDTFVDVYIFNNNFAPATVGTNKYYGHLFDSEGNISVNDIFELSQIPEAGFNRIITGSLIPNLKNELDEEISIDTVMNSSFAETGIIGFINDDLLEMEDEETIDMDGSSYYDAAGKMKEDISKNMLSHVLPDNLKKTVVNAASKPTGKEIDDYLAAEETIKTTNNIINYSVDLVPISDDANETNKFITAMELGIRVGDKIKGTDGSVVEVVAMEILESDVPVAGAAPIVPEEAPDPTA